MKIAEGGAKLFLFHRDVVATTAGRREGRSRGGGIVSPRHPRSLNIEKENLVGGDERGGK